MLSEALKYKAALNRFTTEQFSEATKAFFADRHPIAHLILMMLMAVRDVLLDEAWNTNKLLNELAEAMYTKFQKYWAAPSMVLLIAAVMDHQES
jgi:hypothetical protein